MIGIDELRFSAANSVRDLALLPSEVLELLDRLEAAEKERDALRIDLDDHRALVFVLRKEVEKLRAKVAEKERDALRIENEALRAEVIHIKEVEFPRKAQAVADGWRGKCERLEAKIEQMERQEPVAWMLNCQTLGGDTGWILSWTQSGAGLCNRLQGEENEKRLYALPGAKGETK